MAEAAALRISQLPVVRQLIVMVTVAGAIAGGLALYSWSQQPAFTPVASELADKDASQVAEALRSAGIEFRLEPGGGVSVPQDKLYEARLKLAAAGLPEGTSAGFESMREEQGFGVSTLVENARYQHALETELSRTISALRPVRGARVHLGLPKASAFARSAGAASASVLVELHPGRTLDPAQVQSIVHLVASSIPDLKPDAVTVIDQSGRLLSGQGGGELGLTSTQFDLTRRVEDGYVKRIQELLLPLTGPGRVSAQVSADLDFTETQEARESYTPDPNKIRSEQVAIQTTAAGTSGPQGVPGAASNQPAPPVQLAPAAALAAPGAAAPAAATSTTAGQQMRNETRNFELDKTLTHTRQPSGRLRRLSVAVLVDHLPKAGEKGKAVAYEPLSAEQLEQVRALVREAVGFSESRGDTLSVMSAPFQRETPAAAPPVPLWQQPGMLDWARRGLGAVVVLIIAFAVLRPALRELNTLKILPPPPAPGAQAIPDRPAALAASSGPSGPSYEEKLTLAKGAVAQDPKKVAQVVRTWVGADA